MWLGVKDYRPYADYDLPLLYFGDFHSSRKEEQNKFLLDVSLSRERKKESKLMSLSTIVHVQGS